MVREWSMDVCLLRNKSCEDSSIGTLLKINWKEHIPCWSYLWVQGLLNVIFHWRKTCRQGDYSNVSNLGVHVYVNFKILCLHVLPRGVLQKEGDKIKDKTVKYYWSVILRRHLVNEQEQESWTQKKNWETQCLWLRATSTKKKTYGLWISAKDL